LNFKYEDGGYIRTIDQDLPPIMIDVAKVLEDGRGACTACVQSRFSS
jgi:hypothetical protein